MKILVMSLLRLGDILLHREVARTIKRQYPGCQLHFLIHSQFDSVQALLPEVDRWHSLDRKKIQDILVRREQSPLAAYAELEKVVEEINQCGFDLVLNATHNRFSVRLMDLISAKEKRGVAFDQGRKTLDQNKWQTYFNTQFPELGGAQFHYLEVLQKSLGLDVSLPMVAADRPGVIFLQLLTSDPKKNWGLENFHQLKMQIESQFPNQKVLGLCSPQEKELVSKVFAWNEFITPTLEEARDLLREARLLISGDTSIQHLAAQQGCPVVSLFLGSADPVKTAPWQLGAWVLQGKAECAPCSHSAPCHQPQHKCALSLKVETVFALISGILRQEPIPVSRTPVYLTQAHQKSFAVLMTQDELRMKLEQSVWAAYLDGSSVEVESEKQYSAEMIEKLQNEHFRFEKSVQDLKRNQTNVQSIENEFPLWRDSLIRYKLENSLEETLALIEIRSGFIRRLKKQKEASDVGNSRQSHEERFAQA